MQESEWRRGWPTLLAAFCAQGVALFHFYSLGMFFVPLEQEFGWSRTVIAGGLSLQALFATIGSPFVGALVDRMGARKVGLAGIAAYGLALAGLSLTPHSVPVYLLLWTLVSMGYLCASAPVWMAETVRCFKRNRGMAMSIVMSSSGLTAVVTPPLVQLMIDSFGWRGAYLGLSAIALFGAGPLVLLFFGRLVVEEAAAPAAAAPEASASVPTEKPPAAWRLALSPTILRIIIATGLFGLCSTGISMHLVPFAVGRGVSPLEAASMASVVGVAAVAGRLLVGSVLDRLPPKPLAIAIYLTLAAAVMVLLNFESDTAIWVGAALLGISTGCQFTTIAYVLTRIIPTEVFGTLFGVFIAVLTLTTGTAAMVAAMVFDISGTYSTWFVFCGVTLVLVVGLILSVPLPGAARPLFRPR